MGRLMSGKCIWAWDGYCRMLRFTGCKYWSECRGSGEKSTDRMDARMLRRDTTDGTGVRGVPDHH